MNYKKLGKSDIEVSEVSFGCMSLDDDHEANKNLLLKAFDKGINFFDTADLYQFGENEKSVGKAFKGIRDQLVIATKVGNQWRKDKSGWDWNPTKEYIFKAVDESLRRLQTDYIDLYQLHGGTIEDPMEETIEAFEYLKQVGKIRAYGISSIRPNVIRTYIEKSNIDSVMMQYSLLDRRPEESCLGILEKAGISVITRGSLAKGLLVGKEAKDYLNYQKEEVGLMAKNIYAISQKHKVSPVQIALGYVLAHSAISSVVCGIRTENQLEDIVAEEVKHLSKEDLKFLQNIIKANVYQVHR